MSVKRTVPLTPDTLKMKNAKSIKYSKIVTIILAAIIIIAGIVVFYNYYNNPVNKAKRIVSEMSTDEKIGQILMLTFRQWENADSPDDVQNVTVLNDDIRSIIGDYDLGGIALFAENCTDTEQLVHLTYDMQQASLKDGGLPLLIYTDQEGGNVTRAKFGTAFSGNMAIGASGDVDNAYTVGRIIGKELDALGINCVSGPVADVNSNENNPIIGVRSFSGEVNVVSEMASAMAKGFESSNVVSCAKHFPGHGDTSTDSHTSLPLVEKSYEEWILSDGAPFAAMIKNKSTDLIMTAHIQYPGLDDTRVLSPTTGEEVTVPATMSKKILTDILKGKLGFKGAIITDAMDMDAIDGNFGVNDAVVSAIDAGTDMILMPFTISSMDDVTQLDKLFDDIKTALGNGRLTEERLNDAAARIICLKIEKGILDKNYDFDLDEAAENALKIVGSPDHRKIEREMALRCIDVKYDGEFHKFTPSASDKIVCVMPRDGETFSAEHAFIRMKKEGIIPDAETECYNYEPMWVQGEDPDSKLIEAVCDADYLILGFFQTADTLMDSDNIRNVAFDEILKYANTKNIAILWEYLPYGTERYSSAYPCFVIYNSVGMLEKDIGAETYSGKYGPAIPAGIETIFEGLLEK